MNIGILHQYGLMSSGSGVYVARLAEELWCKKHTVHVFCLDVPAHLQFAESLKEITYAEAQYELVDKILSDAEFARMLDKILSNPGFAELISRILHDDDLSRELGQLVDRVLAEEDFRTNLAALVGTT